MRRRAELERWLRTVPVVTDAQLARRGLGGTRLPRGVVEVTPAPGRGLPRMPGWADLSFVVREEYADLEAAALRHLAGVGEGYSRARLPGEHELRLAQPGDFPAGPRPDAVVCSTREGRTYDYVIEYDAGYKAAVQREKMRAFARLGFPQIVWATSVHAQVNRIAGWAREAWLLDELPGVEGIQVLFVDFWTPSDRPYGPRPRCGKALARSIPAWVTPATAGSAGDRSRGGR